MKKGFPAGEQLWLWLATQHDTASGVGTTLDFNSATWQWNQQTWIQEFDDYHCVSGLSECYSETQMHSLYIMGCQARKISGMFQWLEEEAEGHFDKHFLQIDNIVYESSCFHCQCQELGWYLMSEYCRFGEMKANLLWAQEILPYQKPYEEDICGSLVQGEHRMTAEGDSPQESDRLSEVDSVERWKKNGQNQQSHCMCTPRTTECYNSWTEGNFARVCKKGCAKRKRSAKYASAVPISFSRNLQTLVSVIQRDPSEQVLSVVGKFTAAIVQKMMMPREIVCIIGSL